MLRFSPPSFGWRPDLPDFRDFTHETPEILELLKGLKARRRRGSSASEPMQVDLREHFSEPLDQGPIASSPAHACAGLMEYFEQRASGRRLEPSRLFLHYNARRLAQSFDVGTNDLRATLKAAATCGALPERYWPYDPAKLDVTPDAFHYSIAARFRDLRYVRLDSRDAVGSTTLEAVRSFLAGGFPVAFGLAVPTSLTRRAEIVYRPTFESVLGGQALVAVGYDDRWLGSCRGALLVRNSWGPEWGEGGYGLVPYGFVAARLAVDFWTMLKPDWLASGEFRRPTVVDHAGRVRPPKPRFRTASNQRTTGGL
jgi:C1A family cysteine protease